MVKWIKEKIKSAWEKFKFYLKLRRMDKFWYEHGGCCFGLFPPSFYYTHTEEEIERIRKEEIGKLEAIIEDYERQYKESKEAL